MVIVEVYADASRPSANLLNPPFQRDSDHHSSDDWSDHRCALSWQHHHPGVTLDGTQTSSIGEKALGTFPLSRCTCTHLTMFAKRTLTLDLPDRHVKLPSSRHSALKVGKRLIDYFTSPLFPLSCAISFFRSTTQTRYSYLLNLLFVAMAYSGGMFVMNALSFLFFFITYWVDKTMLLRFYRRPPHREDTLQRQVTLVQRVG